MSNPNSIPPRITTALAALTATAGSRDDWLLTEATPDLATLETQRGRFRLGEPRPLAFGLQERLLGAAYAQALRADPQLDPRLSQELAANDNCGFSLLVTLAGEAAGSVPLFTLLRQRSGDSVFLEGNRSRLQGGALFAALILYGYSLAISPPTPGIFDTDADFMTLGALNIVQHHASERLRRYPSHKVRLQRGLCSNCLRCVTSCAEMKASTGAAPAVLGPAPAHCTTCGLCQQVCSYLQGGPAAASAAPDRVTKSPSLQLHGADARALMSWMENGLASAPPSLGLRAEKIAALGLAADNGRDNVVQVRLSAGDAATALILTSESRESHADAPCSRAILRPARQAAVLLCTESGEVEFDLAAAALKAGVAVRGVLHPESRPGIAHTNKAIAWLAKGDCLETRFSLEDLVRQNQVDVVLAPAVDLVPPEAQALLLEQSGSNARVLAPHIPAAFTWDDDPLLAQIRRRLLAIFPRHPQLLEAEAAIARSYLENIEGHSAALHARYRSMAFGSGHSACPTCAELQVLAIPVYMAIAFSLARGEIPQVTFTCETGCMSETLNKVKEVAQKVRGGRTVFGGGFAFGEAVALAEEIGIRQGRLPKQRRYVVSQGGDGGAVIGLPAWLNALRQKAFLIPQRHADVLHFITITDTQVYSNTGGEASASSLFGMGTLTTPVGQLILGNQKIQWNLINLAAEFPGVLVGCGHSADKREVQKFWHQADQLGRSAMRWDVTPCPETGKFFGKDPDELALALAHAGLLPQVEFVGRLRKRVAPINPADRAKPWRQWQRQPKPVLSALARDPRFRPLLRLDPESGEYQPMNSAAHLILAQLERHRDVLNQQIDMEDRLVRTAEERVENFFAYLSEQWRRSRHQPDNFAYGHLFDAAGKLKAEFGPGLKREMLEVLLAQGQLPRYYQRRQHSHRPADPRLEKVLANLGCLERLLGDRALLGHAEVDEQVTAMLQEMQRLWSSWERDHRRAASTLAQELDRHTAAAEAGGPSSSESAQWQALAAILDRLLEDRALAKQAELSQLQSAARLRQLFLRDDNGKRRKTDGIDSASRAGFRQAIASRGGFALTVASLAGDRGIALNRIFSRLFTDKGAWAGMAWQFGSSKRGTPVLSATFVDAVPIQRKDSMLSLPVAVATVTNYGELRHHPELLFANLAPDGYLIVNTDKDPETVRQELLQALEPGRREVVARLRREGGLLSEQRQLVSQLLYRRRYQLLEHRQRAQADQLLAIAKVTVITVDMDGIMREVTGSEGAVANLVAVAPIFRALELLGLPLDWKRDQEAVIAGFPAAVLRNRILLQQYLQAIELARRRARGFPRRRGDRVAATPATPTPDPADHLMEMGGTLAGMVLSQLAIPEHPLCYVGFPITPAGNPFYAMAQAQANGHPYVYVDEVNPSEKVAAEKLLGIARVGGMLPVTFTASQGWRLFSEVIPQFVGGRLEGLFLIARRALAAPALNIEESHTDFMSFRDDGGLMLAPKSIQEYVPALYLARLMTHFAKLPVILSIGGITDTHKIELVRLPAAATVRAWLREVLADYDFLEHKLLNRQGHLVVHGPSATSEHYQETQSEVERAHWAAMEAMPYAIEAVRRLTGYTFDELEVQRAGDGPVQTAAVILGSLYPNCAEAVRELEAEGWGGIASLSVRWFNPFPAAKLAQAVATARVLVIFDRSNSFGSDPPLASRVLAALARHRRRRLPVIHTIVGGLGGREITVAEFKEILLFAHLVLQPPSPRQRRGLADIVATDAVLQTLLDELAAQWQRNVFRHTRVPSRLRPQGDGQRLRQQYRRRLQRLLAGRQYHRFLTNYGSVAFVGAKEALEESELRRRAVLRLEILHGRRSLSRGNGDPRPALILLLYSHRSEDWRLAATALADFRPQQPALQLDIARLLQAHEVKLAQAGFDPTRLGSQEPARPPAAGAGGARTPTPETVATAATTAAGSGSPLEPLLSFSSEEAALIKRKIAAMVVANSTLQVPWNPGDYLHPLLQALMQHPQSQLFQAKWEEDAALIDAYEELYLESIYTALHHEILAQDFAPELNLIFKGAHREALGLVVVAACRAAARQGNGERQRQEVVATAIKAGRRYLQRRLLPQLPKKSGFYLDYFQAVIEPQLRREALEALENEVGQ